MNKVTPPVHVTASGVTHCRSKLSFKLIIPNYSVSCCRMKVGGEGQVWQYGHHAEEITDLCFYLNGAQRSLHNRPLR